MRGGSRAGAGRPKVETEKTISITIRIPETLYEKIKKTYRETGADSLNQYIVKCIKMRVFK